MSFVLSSGTSLDEKVTVTLNQRDMLLLRLCLRLVQRSHSSSALCFDIQSLRDKLPNETGESR
jgi:hypothetical protein